VAVSHRLSNKKGKQGEKREKKPPQVLASPDEEEAGYWVWLESYNSKTKTLNARREVKTQIGSWSFKDIYLLKIRLFYNLDTEIERMKER
jgi:hypothetical protein